MDCWRQSRRYRPGGRVIGQYLNVLRETLWEYYGQLNEIRINIRIKPEDRIEKPEALIRFEQARSLQIPYIDGGLVDQPFIWLQEHGVIVQFLTEWAVIEASQARPEQPNAR
jgi:hypothetical protein